MAVNDKRTLYVGGLDERVDRGVLHAAFVPFGEITDVMIPLETTTGEHRGFGFVTFEQADDAADAIDNMADAELFGRVLKVNVSKPQQRERSNKPGTCRQDSCFAPSSRAFFSRLTPVFPLLLSPSAVWADDSYFAKENGAEGAEGEATGGGAAPESGTAGGAAP